MKFLNSFKSKEERAQAFVELCLLTTLMIVLAFGAVEFGNMISLSTRMASVTREASRMLNSDDYETNTITNVFNVVTNMIYPSDLRSNGKVIVTLVQRLSGTSTNLATNDPSYAGSNRDYIVITDRFYYPNTGNPKVQATNAPAWNTLLPTNITNGSGKYIPYTNSIGGVNKEMLLLQGKAAVVEVFHTNKLVAPLNTLGFQLRTYLYDRSSF
jgi:Flp pilus assembly protein TadG